MRIVVAFLTLGTLVPCAANAASIIAVAEPTEHPSIVILGAPSASSTAVIAPQGSIAGSSIIALGDPGLAPADEKVSAIGNESKRTARGFGDTPMVIRGGIVGDAFVRTAPAAPNPAVAPATTADAQSKGQPEPETAATSSTAYEQPAEPK
jgi:hypothetical protein